jgi:hypothetical protein
MGNLQLEQTSYIGFVSGKVLIFFNLLEKYLLQMYTNKGDDYRKHSRNWRTCVFTYHSHIALCLKPPL